MPGFIHCVFLSCALVATLASAREVTVLQDLDAEGRVTLSREELGQLLPNASMSRVSEKGNTHFWKNDSSGSFVVSSNNRATSGKASTAPGKWHISDDGRFCVLIEWKGVDTEEWCRYIVKAGGIYYATKSDKAGSEKAYRLEISK